MQGVRGGNAQPRTPFAWSSAPGRFCFAFTSTFANRLSTTSFAGFVIGRVVETCAARRQKGVCGEGAKVCVPSPKKEGGRCAQAAGTHSRPRRPIGGRRLRWHMPSTNARSQIVHALSWRVVPVEVFSRMMPPSVGARFQLTHAPGWRMPSAGACSQMAKTHRCQLPISAVCAYRRNESQQIRYECRYFDDEERERELTSASFCHLEGP